MESGSTDIDLTSIKARALAPVEEPGSAHDPDKTNAAHQALYHALSQPPKDGKNDHSEQVAHIKHHAGNATGLPSTVPESLQVFDAAVIESLPPQAQSTVPPRTMNSQGALEPTQELSPSYWEFHISKTRSAVNTTDVETQHTLNEGDDGHVDITSSFVQPEEDKEPEVEDTREFSPSQSQRRLSQFPESQRLKTPAVAGKKRDYNGNTRGSPELPRGPVLRSGGVPTPAHLMGLSQVFDATQAATSPFVNAGINLLSDRPSPNLEVDNRPATATVSSPLRPMSEFRRATTEPATRYISVAQSQERRNRRAQLKLLEQVEDESDDDDFDEEPSLVKRQRRRREFEARANEQFRLVSSPSKAKSRARGSSAINSSPVIAAQRSSPSPPPGLRVSGARVSYGTGLAQDNGEDVEPSEAETEQEEEVEVEIRRSSQTSPMDEADKENYNSHVQIPETTARLHRITDTLPSEVEASPSLRHAMATTGVSIRSAAGSGPVAVANSQPSQPASKSQTSKQNPKSSSTSGLDFIPQSQGATGQQSASMGPTQTPPASPQPPKPPINVPFKIDQERGKGEAGQEANVVLFVSEQASAPAQLANIVPETDSSRVIQSHQPSISTNSAPGANTLNTSVFETAATRLPPASNLHTKLSELSSPPINTTPPGKKRKRMSEISAEPSPQQASTQGFDPMEALHMSSGVQPFLDESPIKPNARQVKRRKVQESNNEIGETASRRLTRALHQSTATPVDESVDPADDAQVQPASHSHPTFDTSDLRASTRSRVSVWEMDVSPPQKRVSTRALDRQAPMPVIVVEQALKQKQSASTAPEKKLPEKKGRASTRAQIQTETSSNDLSQCPAQIPKPPSGEVTAPNFVFACFNGKTRAYYPARCLGSADGQPLRYRVQWEGYEPDEVDAFGVRSLDLRVGDQVKIDMRGFPKVSHIIRGFQEKAEVGELSKCLTDIRGHKKLLVAPKQRKSLPADVSTESISEVPVSAIYLDSNMWSQMKDRDYEFKPPQEVSMSLSGYATPMDRASTPSTPSSRSRRQPPAHLAMEAAPLTGIFANMAFAISYEDGDRKPTLVNLIRENGGRLLQGSFMEMLESDVVSLKSQYANTGFTALIANKHSRKEKYMQALALGLPCLSGRWIEACNQGSCLVDWHPYLLAAGESEELEGATKSRIMDRMDPTRTKLWDILQSRLMPLVDAKVIFVLGRGKSEVKRKPYLFLIQALGAEKIEKVADLKAAKDLINSEEDFDWVFVEDSSVEVARSELLGKGGRKELDLAKLLEMS